MRKRLILFCSLLSTGMLLADEFEKNYGNGVIHIQPDSFTTIDFYSGPDSAFTYRLHIQSNSWSFSPIVNGTMIVGTQIPQWLSTLYFLPCGAHARVDILAVDSSKAYYRTILEDDKGREVWIKKVEEVSFLSWFGFFRSVASIRLLSEEIILHNKPREKSKKRNCSQIYSPVEVRYARPLEMKGHWLKVEIQYPDNNPDLPWHVETGWIKWRDEKQLLITYSLMGY